MPRPHEYRKIIIEQVYDGTWQATTDTFDIERHGDPVGSGKTASQAVEDLMEQFKAAEPAERAREGRLDRATPPEREEP